MATTPYSTVRPLFSEPPPSWMSEEDSERIRSYNLYDDIYWNVPQSFKLVQRGSEENPLYIPSGKIIVETMQRYAGAKMSTFFDPAAGTPEQQAQAAVEFQKLFARERFIAQYNSNKRFGIIRGDWVFHLMANPLKPEGTRIKIKGIHPGQYFPIVDNDDVDHILGVNLIEEVVEGDTTVLILQQYLKSDHPDHPGGGETFGGPVSYSRVVLEVDGWDTPDRKVVRVEAPPVIIHPEITSIPVYHIRMFEEPQNPFGSSAMRGVERVIAGINQAITDEELALAMAGLGMYKSTTRPVDDDGNDVPWQLGPGRVVEIPNGESFDRVSGITSVDASQDHLAYLADQIGRATGATEAAQGQMNVEVAESGIALQLRMSPILSSAEEQDEGIKSTMNQMLWDLRTWIRVYEGINLGDVVPQTRFGLKLPVDTKRRFDQLLQMYSAVPPLITGEYFRDAVRELGFDIPVDMQAQLDRQAAAADPMGSRLDEEAGETEINSEGQGDADL